MDRETQLAREAAGGNAAAFAQLVRIHEGRVRRFLRRLLHGPGEEDLAQEVFMKAWRMRTQWRDERNYGAWLMSIAWTRFLDAHRAARRRPILQGGLESDRWHSPGDADAAIDLARAMNGLDARGRAAAQLCFAEGYSHGEAAAILGLPLGTVKSIVKRAREQLAKALETSRDG